MHDTHECYNIYICKEGNAKERNASIFFLKIFWEHPY